VSFRKHPDALDRLLFQHDGGGPKGRALDPRGCVVKDRAPRGVEGGPMIGDERNPGKFSHAIRERPAAETENALLAKTSGGPRGSPAREGEGGR
jgi:hypothetical protein